MSCSKEAFNSYHYLFDNLLVISIEVAIVAIFPRSFVSTKWENYISNFFIHDFCS